MGNIHLLTVGKNLSSQLRSLEDYYLKQLSLLKISFHQIKEDADLEITIKNFQKKNYEIILLSEIGSNYNSQMFSQWLFKRLSQQTAELCFTIAGAEGFSQKILNYQFPKISLSPLTFPHQLARIILIEQLYRAEMIFKHHPYHK